MARGCIAQHDECNRRIERWSIDNDKGSDDYYYDDDDRGSNSKDNHNDGDK